MAMAMAPHKDETEGGRETHWHYAAVVTQMSVPRARALMHFAGVRTRITTIRALSTVGIHKSFDLFIAKSCIR